MYRKLAKFLDLALDILVLLYFFVSPRECFVLDFFGHYCFGYFWYLIFLNLDAFALEHNLTLELGCCNRFYVVDDVSPSDFSIRQFTVNLSQTFKAFGFLHWTPYVFSNFFVIPREWYINYCYEKLEELCKSFKTPWNPKHYSIIWNLNWVNYSRGWYSRAIKNQLCSVE